jgi:hypothetical protein
MAMRDELVAATSGRYLGAKRDEKKRILDEFVAVTGFHRKHAMRLLRLGRAAGRDGHRPERRFYDDAVRTALTVLWEASDRICGKRLRPLAPLLVEAMERHGHLRLDPDVRRQLLAMSAATIDRALREAKAANGRRRRHRPVSEFRRSIPVRTFSDWDDPPPGFCEVDLVWHSGPNAKGSFVQTLTVTDIATGWTECAPLLVREQKLLTEVLTEIRKLLPFTLLGFDSDNDSVFINETVRDYCLAGGITFTRCRPYRKNDQAWVEQKNGAVVRKIAGYRRFEGVQAAAALADLYATVRLFVNFFQPSFKLAEKDREGARVHKRYHKPATPCRGYLLEDLLARTFGLHGVEVARSFRRNEGGEQIDGAFRFDGWHYIVECRWRAEPADMRQLDGLVGQVGRSGHQTMGLFLSINGWSGNVVPLLKQGGEKWLILMDGYDLRCVLARQIELRSLLISKIAALNFKSEPFLSAGDLLRSVPN